VNWEQVAAEMNLKNSNVAKVRFGQIKKKMTENLHSPSSSGSGAKTPGNKVAKAGTKPKGRPRKDSNATPTKKTPKSAAKVTEEDGEESVSVKKFEDSEEKFKTHMTDDEYEYLMQTVQVCAQQLTLVFGNG
jgi:hypothetical protein